MKTLIIIFAVVQISLAITLTKKNDKNEFDAVFFENINFKGILKVLYLYIVFNLSNRNFCFKGKFHIAHFKPNVCVDLPNAWHHRASSLLVNQCVVVYTTRNCKYNKESQIFAGLSEKNFDVAISQPDEIPNFSFYGSL